MIYTAERREAARRRSLAMHAEGLPRDPTPEEIAAKCAEIQETWTSRERRYRLPRAARWDVPEMRCVDFCVG